MAITRSRQTQFVSSLYANIRAFLREPFYLVVLFVLPPIVVFMYGKAMQSLPAMPFLETVPETLGYLNGAVFAVAFLAGLVGLFQSIRSRDSDHRLVVSGFGRLELLGSRLVTIILVSVVATVVCFGVVVVQVSPEAPLVAFGALLLAAVVYSLIGILIGAIVPRQLEGSLVLVFLADMDDALSSGMLNIDSELLNVTPLHYPHTLFSDAVLEGTVQSADLVAGVVYASCLLVAVVAVYTHTIGGVAR
jgi:ABC-type transport system involved in multi-copper enzyme maturation permease subunit